MTANTAEKRFSLIALGAPAGVRTMPVPGRGGSGPQSDVTLNYAGTLFNRNIRADAIAAGWNGTALITITVNVAAGCVIGSSSPSTPGLQTGSGYPMGMPAIILTIASTATITGCGGLGGTGGASVLSGNPTGKGTAGGKGGTALKLQTATTITNNGAIWGGGGGGAGGHSDDVDGGGGGGGGAGASGGTGGPGGFGSVPGTAGGTGILTSGAAGGNGPVAFGFVGGTGGGPGLAGGDNGTGDGVAGGVRGDYIVGNAFATFVVLGDVRGGVVP